MAEPPLVGDEYAGYRLLSVLGRGGMSVVYKAENPRLGSVVALKLLAPGLAGDDVFRARFLEESRIAASLNHPNVIPIYDAGSSGGLLYIAMRYVSGTDVRQMIKKRGRLIPAVALSLTGQAARALDAAHRKGLVHRDVKPGNLLIERASDEDDPDHVYLSDFGITKHAIDRSGMTSTGQFLGTIDYVAPEQIRGMSVLGQADQYSLGCVLYECLTGRVPFEKDLDAAIIWAHVEESPTMPTVLRPDLPPEVDGVFARVLAKQPGDRYASCREFIEAMRVALGGLAADPSTLGTLGGLTAPSQAGPMAGDPALELHRPPTEQVAAASQASQARQGDTMTSHRREPGQAPPAAAGGPGGGPPPPGGRGPRRRWYARPGWIAALTALVLAAAGAGAWALVSSGGSGSHPHSTAMSSMSMSMSPTPRPTGPSALMSALVLANQTEGSKGLLPPSTCKQNSATMVTCTAPAAGISGVTFRTYPSLPALYAAYVAQVKALNSGSFQQNFQDCNDTHTYGEVEWNHQFVHPNTYTVAQMSAGMVTDDQAVGRLFCTFTNGYENIVWTQDDGHMMAWVTGLVHADVFNWWALIHHTIGLGGSPMKM
jgi:serine/threonine-protein kinase